MKKIAILLLASMLTLTLSACNTGIESRESSAEQTEAQTTTTVQTTPAPAETTTQPTTTAATTPAPSTTTTTAQTTAQTEAQTTTSVQTAPAPEWTETAETGTKYIAVSCYSRNKAVIGAETVKLYNVNDKVNVTAKTDTGYYKLDTGAFVHSDYLSDSKVTVQTTTTTQAAPAPTETEQPFLVYAQHDDCPVYIDINCTRWGGCCTTANGSYVAVEILKDKGLYKVENAGSTEEGRYEYCYAKMSDFSPTKVYIDPIFNSPLNIAAIKQYMIDYGTKTLGLEYYERQNVAYSYDRPPENSCWFPPRDIEDGDEPAWLKKVIDEKIPSTMRGCSETGGGEMTNFSVWIREVRDGEEGHTDGGRFKTEGKRMFEVYILY